MRLMVTHRKLVTTRTPKCQAAVRAISAMLSIGGIVSWETDPSTMHVGRRWRSLAIFVNGKSCEEKKGTGRSTCKGLYRNIISRSCGP
jgi:hypothetical protein